MGGSGSGKTTLLNAIAGRLDKRQTSITGDIKINGEDPRNYRNTNHIGYLQQEDYLLPYITVRETLQFAADLRFSLTQAERTAIVDDLLLELGLKSCADVIVGDAYANESGTGGTQGISGGERRRVSAAIQLLTRPSLLICDEVTSGLDAFTSFELAKTLDKYARSSGKTVILSIHQPRSEIFHLLSASGGQLVLLAQGDVIYSGPLDKVLSWFESAGLGQCSVNLNPFDYILDQSMIDYSTVATERSSRARIVMLVELWSKRDNSKTHPGTSQLLNITPQPFISVMADTIEYSRDIKVYERERRDRWYTPLPYLLSHVICAIPRNIVHSIAHVTVIYFVTGIRNDSSSISCYLIVALTYTIMQFVRIMVSAIFTDATLILGLDGNRLLEVELEVPAHYYPGPLIQFVGHYLAYLILSWIFLTIINPKRNRRVPNIPPMEFLFRIVTSVFVDWSTFDQMGKIRQSPTKRAQDKLVCKDKDEDSSEETKDLADGDGGHTRVDIFGDALVQRNPMMIKVENLSLVVERKVNGSAGCQGFLELLTRKRPVVQNHLLQNINIVIPPAQLTAILGGSGSGKTTLINALLRRTSPGLKASGDVYYNGSKNPSMKEVSAVCGYVRQDDGLLMSHLTVRETLRFAAELGMKKSLSRVEKWAKADEILDLIGLQECADVLIGDDDTNGISGGERRRVSIGIELVNEPACLFLDEPTSGLDALTAKTLVLMLKKIASTGRTVVCAIHQPRIDIWNEFDNAFLLMTGGRMAYAGKASETIGYFERAGHALPEHMNPPVAHPVSADFIIDTASVNHRSPELEASSNAVIDALFALHCQQQKTTPVHESLESDGKPEVHEPLPSVAPHYAGFPRACLILTRRNFMDTYRQRGRFLNRVIEPFLITITVVAFYWRLGNDSLGVYQRLGFFQQMTGTGLASMLVALDLYPRQRDVAFREISNGAYSASAFFASFMLNEIPLALLSSVLCNVAAFFITGFSITATSVALFYVVTLGSLMMGESLVLIFSTLMPYGGFALIAATSTILWMSFLSGLMTQHLPWFLHCLSYLDLFKYSVPALVNNDLRGLKIECAEDEIQKGLCLFSTGDQVLEYTKMDHENISGDVMAFVGLCVLYRMIAWAVIVARVRLYARSRSV
ncbi:hypothetical protein BGX28_009323 [Mortierella sp. GBA30]|nr:hypothetical protein BGX28_009323 [Mortierella sp. GBA30]